MNDDKNDKIAIRAHALWEQEGRPHGRDKEHWHRAVREIEAEDDSVKQRGQSRGLFKGSDRPDKARLRGARPSAAHSVRAQLKGPPYIAAKKKRSVGAASAKRDLAAVKARLARFYKPEDIQTWLSSPHRLLHGAKALDLIHAGRTKEVLAVIESLADGSYT